VSRIPIRLRVAAAFAVAMAVVFAATGWYVYSNLATHLSTALNRELRLRAQDLSTVVGQTYQFSFYERGDDQGQTERISLLNVYWGGLEIGSYKDDNHVSGWNHHIINVVATTTTTRIDFQQASSTIGSFGYPGVDGVSVNRVPETASTIYLLAFSFVVCLGVRGYARTRGGRV